jgi:DHA1 family bicyclomycin/chloramphenicol resistance-like MFS transporter
MHKKTMSKWVIYYIILANAIGMMSMDIHLPVLAEITKDLNTSFFMAQQILTIFYVVGIIARITLGPLSDAYGRRKILLLALDIQIIGQAMQVFATNIEFLLLGRVVQALASGGLSILINAIILDIYVGYDRTKMLSISELIQPVSLITAPIIGGYLATFWGWRAGFVFLLINLAFARIVLTFWLKETNTKLRKPSINNAAKDYYRIITNPKFMSYNIMLSSLVSSYMLYAVISSYIYMVKFKLSISEFMLYQTMPLLSQALCVLSYNLFKVNLRRMIGYGIFMAFLALLLSSLVFFEFMPNSPKTTLICMLISCASLGTIFPAAMKFALDIFPSIKGTASSALVVSRGIFSGIAMLLAGYFHEYDMVLFAGLMITSGFAILSWLMIPEAL